MQFAHRAQCNVHCPIGKGLVRLLALLHSLLFLIYSANANTGTSVAQATAPSIVEIETLTANDVLGTGTGFIVDPSGIIVTNFHVIENGDELRVRLESGEEFRRVFVLAHSERFDLAILKISSAELPALKLGSSASLSTGDEVFIMSNPLGLARSFSQGHVSARRVIDGVELLQVSAPISSGSSGGAVLNTQGQVIGVATAMLTDGQNINIAMPIKYVKGLLSEPSQPVTYQDFAQTNWGSSESSGTNYERADGLSPLVVQWIEELGLDPADYRESLLAYGVFEQELVFQLMLSSAILIDQSGYEDYKLGATLGLDEGEVHSTDVEMDRGEYIALAACDRDCGEIFIAIQSDSGWLAGSESGSDLPSAAFSISDRQNVKIQLRMMQCSTEPCFAQFMLLQR